MQDYEGRHQLRNGFLIKKSKTEVLRMVYSYIRRRCRQDQTPAVCKEAKAAFKALSKTFNNDNCRKVRSSADLLFLSWAMILDKTGALEKTLVDEPWMFSAEEVAPILTGIRELIHDVQVRNPAKDAKVFRSTMRKGMNDLASGEKTAVVRYRNDTDSQLHPVPIPSPLHTTIYCAVNVSMQGLRALLAAFSSTLQTSNDLEPVETEGFTAAIKAQDDSLGFASLKAWPTAWGSLGDNSPSSPFAILHEARYLPVPCNQVDRKLLTDASSCGLAKLFAASGENAPAGMLLFQYAHRLMVWRVPVPDQDPSYSSDALQDSGVDAEDAATEDEVANESPLNDAAAVVPERVPVTAPRSGYLHVVGVFILNRVLPFVVRLPVSPTSWTLMYRCV